MFVIFNQIIFTREKINYLTILRNKQKSNRLYNAKQPINGRSTTP